MRDKAIDLVLAWGEGLRNSMSTQYLGSESITFRKINGRIAKSKPVTMLTSRQTLEPIYHRH